jgi:ABC-type antimicrobial peptide transport system permease subunit
MENKEISEKPRIREKLSKHAQEIRKQVFTQMLSLATSGFGLVAALAWNQVIQEFINEYIKPLIGGSSGIISLLIYALVVTLLAVLVTYNLSKLAEKKK